MDSNYLNTYNNFIKIKNFLMIEQQITVATYFILISLFKLSIKSTCLVV